MKLSRLEFGEIFLSKHYGIFCLSSIFRKKSLSKSQPTWRSYISITLYRTVSARLWPLWTILSLSILVKSKVNQHWEKTGRDSWTYPQIIGTSLDWILHLDRFRLSGRNRRPALDYLSCTWHVLNTIVFIIVLND